MKVSLLLNLLLISCGVSPLQPTHPMLISERLQKQIIRMSPLLSYTCADGAPARHQNTDCNTEGDAVSMTGWTLLYGNLGAWEVIQKSIDTNGRPWRNPSRVGDADLNSFSRDQLLGLLEGTVASGDLQPLKSTYQYIQSTGRLCPGDDRCNITGNTLEFIKILLREPVSDAEKSINGWVTQVEASSVPPGYQVHLVSRKIMLHAQLNTLTLAYAKAAATLLKRFPKSLFVRTTDAVVNHKDFLPIANDLATCMESWVGSGNAWIGEEIERGCQNRSYGHEYVSLAKFLLNTKKFIP